MSCKDCGYYVFGYDPDFDMERYHCEYPCNDMRSAPCEYEEEYDDYDPIEDEYGEFYDGEDDDEEDEGDDINIYM